MWKNIDLYLFQLFLISLPFDHFYSELALIALVGYTVLLARREDWKRILHVRVWALTALYGVTLIATTYSPDFHTALSNCFQQLPLLLFPLICAIWQPVLVRSRIRLLNSFSITIVLVIVYLYMDAFRVIHYFDLPWKSVFTGAFTNQHFSQPLDLHATYLSMYAGLCLIHVVSQAMGPHRDVDSPPGPRRTSAPHQAMVPSRARWLYGLGALVLAIGLVQLSAKSVWVALGIIGMVASLRSIYGAHKRRFVVQVSFLVLVVVGLLLWKGTFFKERMISGFQKDMTISDRGSRVARWNALMEPLEVHPLWGYGTGSIQPVTQAAYFSHGLYEAYLLHLNTHNQFLSLGLSAGIWGVLIYLAWLGWGASEAFKSRDIVWMGCISLIMCVSMGENLLEVQHGLFFTAFFFSFFYFSRWTSRQAY